MPEKPPSDGGVKKSESTPIYTTTDPETIQRIEQEIIHGEQNHHEQKHRRLFSEHYLERNPHLTSEQRIRVLQFIESTQGPWNQYDDNEVYLASITVEGDELILQFSVLQIEVISRIALRE